MKKQSKLYWRATRPGEPIREYWTTINNFFIFIKREEKGWSVLWHINGKRVPKNEMKGLTDRHFKNHLDAKKAAESFFIRVMKIVPKLVIVETKLSCDF